MSVKAKITVTATVTVIVEHNDKESLNLFASCITPQELAKKAGKSVRYEDTVEPVSDDTEPDLTLGGESYIDVYCGDGGYRQSFGKDVGYDTFFTSASKIICFSDCSDERIDRMVFHGQEVFYDGWQPGMVFSFHDNTGKNIWQGQFSEWEH